MCDCYEPYCAAPGCQTVVMMHLEDYNTKRSEVEVFCHRHIPEDRSNGTVWLYGRWKAFVRALTPNALEHRLGNHPNVSCRLRSYHYDADGEILIRLPGWRTGESTIAFKACIEHPDADVSFTSPVP